MTTRLSDDGHSIAGGTLLANNGVEWTYAVTNTGTVGLNNVVVTDDNGTPDDHNPLNGDETLDDFAATAVNVTFNGNQYNIGDLNHNGIIDADDPTTGANEAETWQFIATGTAVAGAYTNIATVTTDATGFNSDSIRRPIYTRPDLLPAATSGSIRTSP